MKKTISLLEFYAPSILRYGMSAVVLWFGVQQLIHPDVWTAYVPDSVVSLTGWSAMVFVHINAAVELVFGLLLFLGLWVRIVALLLALHLFDIMYVVGYGEIGVRDFGLSVAMLVVSMNGADPLALQDKK